MTLFNPTLKVERLLVKKDNSVIYDEDFHNGINILSGCNGGGKTSVIQLLMFGLGYEIKNWKDESNSCDFVYIGVCINGDSLTLRRRNREEEKQSMDICFLPLSEATEAPIEEWENHPYSISSKESFSQTLFSVLGIPEAKADANNNNITLHQLFRLLYSDQSNPASYLFNTEPFDSAFKRESIGNYLMGLYDNELYDSKISLQIEEKKLEKVSSKLSAINSIVGKTEFSQNIGDIVSAKDSYLSEISKLNVEALKLKENALISYKEEKKTTERCASKSVKDKNKLLDCEVAIQQLEYEIADSEEFICELLDKSVSIKDSIEIGAHLSEVNFKICPSCSKVAPIAEVGCCNLCGGEKSGITGGINLSRMKNEIDSQIRESERIVIKKKANLEGLIAKRKVQRSNLRKTMSLVTSTMTSINATNESEVYGIYSKIGEFEEKLVTLDKVEMLVNSIAELRAERDSLQKEVNRLNDLIKYKKYQYISREPEVKDTISKHLITILKRDVGAEKEFLDAKNIEFDFASNTVSVNGKTAFSESGAVYLNNAFHVALLMCSLDKEYIRLPRFMVLDGIENGGMEESRSSNFQRVVKDLLEEYQVNFQIIMATKCIDSSLDNSDYIVGDKYNSEVKSLKFKRDNG